MSVIFLNSHRGKSGVLNGERLPEDYILACKFFDCGIIDRSQTLDQGFAYSVLDPISGEVGPPPGPGDFGQVCDAVATDIVERARREDRVIRVLWSGGIDSTVALIALLRVLPKEEYHRLLPLLNMISIDEYPLFFRQYILHQLPFKHSRAPITAHFGKRDLLVTGEHGDQLFGSDKVLPLIQNGLCYEPWEKVLPLHLFEKFSSRKKTDRLLAYLAPQIAAAPVDIRSTFDLFWWLNFSIKWQQVTLRLPVFSFEDDTRSIYDRMHHFFRDERFQQWSINNHPNRACDGPMSYKQAAKDYIFKFTGDKEYQRLKTKEPSLKNVILNRKEQGNVRYRISMGDDFSPNVETFHRDFKNQRIV